MVVDNNNNFISQRENHKLALIQAKVFQNNLSLEAPGMPPFSIVFSDIGNNEQVMVWRDQCQAIDQGRKATDWFSEYLGSPCKLVMMEKLFQRKLDPGYAFAENNQTGFADGYPFLLISQESLNDLNSRLKISIPMNRFRPNIVVEGCRPYEEDSWQKIKIGDIVLEVVKPCVRCAITTIDQSSLATSKEPLATLATYRISPLGGVIFGQNLIHHNNGRLNVGDKVDIMEKK